jgi:hypothetical protein
MLKDCWTCEHFFYDRSTDASDCKKADYLTEAQFDEHFVNDKPNCPCWSQIEEYREGIYE